MSYPRHTGKILLGKHSSKLFYTYYPINYHINSRYSVRIEPDFVTDLASIPRVFTPIVPHIGKYDLAAIVHDHIYQHGVIYDSVCHCEVPVSRALADEVFLQALDYCRVGKWRRRLMYAAVRVGGQFAWAKWTHGAPVLLTIREL